MEPRDSNLAGAPLRSDPDHGPVDKTPGGPAFFAPLSLERTAPAPVVPHMNSVNTESVASVLVVEDEALVRIYLSDLLGQSGFDVIVATNGEDALAVAKRGEVCAVVSDVAMPGAFNGFELARRVRSDCPHTGIILVSGVMEPAGYHLPRGVRFVTKPVKASTLLRLVREVADPRATLPAIEQCTPPE